MLLEIIKQWVSTFSITFHLHLIVPSDLLLLQLISHGTPSRRPCHLEPTALPLQDTKGEAKRKGKDKKATTPQAGLLGIWVIQPGKMLSIEPMHKMDILGGLPLATASQELGLIEPGTHCIVPVPVSMGTHPIRCHGGRVDQ